MIEDRFILLFDLQDFHVPFDYTPCSTEGQDTGACYNHWYQRRIHDAHHITDITLPQTTC